MRCVLIMEFKKEQRYAIKFYSQLGISVNETLSILKQAYGNRCLCKATILRWHKAFTEVYESAELILHGGRSSLAVTDTNANTIATIIREDRRLFLRRLEQLVNISRMSLNRILKNELKMKKVSGTRVPYMLTNEQMAKRGEIFQQWLTLTEEDPNILTRVITCDESWIQLSRPLFKTRNGTLVEYNFAETEEGPTTKSSWKLMLIVFFDCRDILYQYFISPKTAINAQYYRDCSEY